MTDPVYRSEGFSETFRARVREDYFLEIAIRREIALLQARGHYGVAAVLVSYLPERPLRGV